MTTPAQCRMTCDKRRINFDFSDKISMSYIARRVNIATLTGRILRYFVKAPLSAVASCPCFLDSEAIFTTPALCHFSISRACRRDVGFLIMQDKHFRRPWPSQCRARQRHFSAKIPPRR